MCCTSAPGGLKLDRGDLVQLWRVVSGEALLIRQTWKGLVTMIFKPGQSVEHKGETFTFVNVGVSNAVNYAVLKRTDTNDKRTFEAVKLAEVQPSERK